MKAALFGLTLLAICLVGCTTKSKSRATARAAFAAGRRQAMVETQQAGVFFRGEVKNPMVKWSEGLTLSRALVAAEWYGQQDPVRITIIRKGEPLVVDPRDLLEGKDDPGVFPGDVVEVQR